MLASEFDTGKYLNAKAAGEYNGTTLVIYQVTPVVIRDVKKMVIGFENVEKELVVNKTNRGILAAAFGDDTDAWLGKSVVLHLTRVMFEGQLTPSIVLEAKSPAVLDVNAERAKKAKK